MTEREQLDAIARLAGFFQVGTQPQNPQILVLFDDAGNMIEDSLPNFLTDLNAIHRVVMKQPALVSKAMRFWLYEMTDQMSAHDATAAQRSEALLRVHNLWKVETIGEMK